MIFVYFLSRPYFVMKYKEGNLRGGIFFLLLGHKKKEGALERFVQVDGCVCVCLQYVCRCGETFVLWDALRFVVERFWAVDSIVYSNHVRTTNRSEHNV